MPGLPLTPRKLVAGSLGLAAKGLQVGALAARVVAERLGQSDGDGGVATPPSSSPAPAAREARPSEVSTIRTAPPEPADLRPGRVSAPPVEPVPMVDQHARTYETHAAELADTPAAQLVRKVRELSTDELRALYEHEQANKKRKSVLKEIEAQLTPAG